jgi:putative SOS response-associated peptidase YedK
MRGGRELLMARWGIRPPFEGLKGKNRNPSVTNIRNVASPHWRRWLELENRCVVPSSSFSDNEVLPDGMRPPV